MRILSALLSAVFLVAGSVAAQGLALEILPSLEGSQLVARNGESVQVLRETATLIVSERLVAVPDHADTVAVWEEISERGEATTWFAPSIAGSPFHAARSITNGIHLQYGSFDPLRGVPGVPAHLDAAAGGSQWIVQYWTNFLPSYGEVLASLGAKSTLFMPDHANVVEMDGATAAAVAKLPFVRWVGSFHPAYRLGPILLRDQMDGWAPVPTRDVNVMSFTREPGVAARLEALIGSLGGTVIGSSPMSRIVHARLGLDQVQALANSDLVQWMDVPGEKSDDMDIARDFHGSLYVETFGYDGTGVRGEVLDGGTETTHPDFVPAPVVHGGNSASSHGTCTYGQVFASGLNNAAASGTLHNAQGICSSYNSLGNRHTHTAELVNPALPYQAVFQTNSWGNTQTTVYNSISSEMDQILFDFDITITQSQSNTGNQTSRPQAWAKNIIAVGGIRHYNTLSASDDAWAGSASIGPAQDGRIKPDLASFYDNILTTDRVGSSGYASGNYYSSFGGTSGATPIVAGMVGQFYAMWANGEFNNPVNPTGTVFSNRPANTTAKAFMINTAKQWTFSGAAHDLTRVHQGWGHPDLRNMYDNRNNIFVINETNPLQAFQTAVYSLVVNPGTPELKATVVYREPAGTTSSSQHRINDLDLKVTAPSGTVYWGNNGMLASMYTTPAGSANNKDNVENVFVLNPQAGTWTIEVIASELNQDNNVATPELDADFALVVSGVVPIIVPPTYFYLDMTTTGVGDLSLSMGNVPAGTSQGYTLFSANTAGGLGTGPLVGIWPDPLTWISFGSPVAPGNPFHWTWPAVGVWPDAPINFGAGSLPSGLVIDGVGLAFGAGFSYLGATPVKRIGF